MTTFHRGPVVLDNRFSSVEPRLQVCAKEESEKIQSLLLSSIRLSALSIFFYYTATVIRVELCQFGIGNYSYALVWFRMSSGKEPYLTAIYIVIQVCGPFI